MNLNLPEVNKEDSGDAVVNNFKSNLVKSIHRRVKEVVKMVANNAFMIKEMKEKVEKEARKQDKIAKY